MRRSVRMATGPRLPVLAMINPRFGSLALESYDVRLRLPGMQHPIHACDSLSFLTILNTVRAVYISRWSGDARQHIDSVADSGDGTCVSSSACHKDASIAALASLHSVV